MQNANCKMQIANCRRAKHVGNGARFVRSARQFEICNCQFAICNRFYSRPGVTLVELLVTMLILSMLAAMILGVAAVAGDTGRETKTRSIVARLHTLLMEHVETYKTRRVKLRDEVVDAINSSTSASLDTAAEKGAALAEARLYALREMM